MATLQDTFSNSDNLSTLTNSEVVAGLLQPVQFSHCIDLDGSSNATCIDFGSIEGTDAIALAESDITLVLWVRFDPELGNSNHSAGTDNNTKDFARMFDKSTNSNSEDGYGLYILRDGRITPATNKNSWIPPASSRILAEDGKWHQIVWTIERIDVGGGSYNTKWFFYFDGLKFLEKIWVHSDATLYVPANATATMRLGSRTSSPDQNFNGKLRGFYLHNAALSPIEVAKTYYDNYHPSASLVDFWDFSESSGSTIASNSGNFDGTLSGNAAFFAIPFSKPWSNTESSNIGALMSSPSSIDSFSYTFGSHPHGKHARVQFSSDGSNWKSNDGSTIPSGIYRFDGVDDQINLGGITFGSGSWSFCCWVRSTFDSTGSLVSQSIAGNRNTGGKGTEKGWRVYIDGTGSVPQLSAIVDYGDGNYLITQYSNYKILDGKWHHVCATWDADTQSIKLYFDGSITNEDLTTNTTSGSYSGDDGLTDVKLGRSLDNAQPLEGEICHPLIFTNHDLSASEVANIYKYHQIPSANLANEYLFNGNANDNVGSDNGTVTGAVNYTGVEHLPSIGYSLKTSESYRFTDLESTGQEITIPDADQLDFGTGSFTVAFDMYLDEETDTDSNGWHGLVRKSDGYLYLSTMTGFGFTTNGGGAAPLGYRNLYFYIGDGTTAKSIHTGDLYLGPEYNRVVSQTMNYFTCKRRWCRVVGVADRSSNLLSLYVDGYKYDTDVDISAVTGSVSTSLGAYIGENFRHWKGKIANVTFWNEAKDQSFIQGELENGYVDLTDSALVGYWPLSGDADDKTSYANHGSLGSGSTAPISEIDLYRMNGTTPSQQTVDLSSLSLTDTVYYRLVTDTTDFQQYPISLSEVTFEYTGGGGGGGDPITGPTAKTLSFASSNGDEEIIAAPDANKNIVLLGATSSVACVLKETDASGEVIAYIPAGHSKFKAPVKVASGTAVHVQGASNITLFFTQIHS